MAAHGIRFITRWDADYPKWLKEVYDAPIGLYWKMKIHG